MTIALILVIVALMVLAVAGPRPYSWISLGLTVLAILVLLTGWRP